MEKKDGFSKTNKIQRDEPNRKFRTENIIMKKEKEEEKKEE